MSSSQPEQDRKWWRDGVCYQVWPQSFKDSNDDGIGDIPGLTSKLDYLKDLGVDYVWMSPMYASPRDDYGYDISDYEAVDPRFGTMQEMDELIEAVHTRGMRLILDLVINHTSSQHQWYKESAKSKDNPYSDYYIWRDPKIVDGKKQPPNNWRSFFGGSAWEYVEARDQYYLHMFLKSMPELNWEDSGVRRAIYKSAIEFWLAKGIDGFRVDVVTLYSKDQSFPEGPVTNTSEEYQHPPNEAVVDGPRMHEFLQEQRKEALDKYGDVVLVGESGSTNMDMIKGYLSPTNRELDMIFDFSLFVGRGMRPDKPAWEWDNNLNLKTLREGIIKSQSFVSEHGLWSTTFLENHDSPRSISNHGSHDPKYETQSGKLLALMIAVMSGTLFLYQGQEIGMRNVPIEWPETELKDPPWLTLLEEAYEKVGANADARRKAREAFQRCGRDHSRTPVQWTGEEPYAGFGNSKPWIRVHDNFKEGINVADQEKDVDSLLSFWKKLLKFRKQHSETLTYGHTEFVDNENENVLSIIKHAKRDHAGTKEGNAKMLVIMSHSDEVQPLPDVEKFKLDNASVLQDGKKVVFRTGGSDSEAWNVLQPWEGRVYQL